jgi:uncharacterized protein YqgV (UPF0045/DUF77 family)
MDDKDIIRKKQELMRVKLNNLRQLCMSCDLSLEILEKIDEIESVVSAEEQENQAELSAQMSLYPLRQPKLSPVINAALKVLKRHSLKLIPGSMSTVIIGEENELWSGLRQAFSEASQRSEVVMILAISNACPKPS